MKDFFVPKDLLLFSNSMGMNSDFSVRGFSGGISEASATLTVTVSSGAVPELWTPGEISGAFWFDPNSAAHRSLSGSAIISLIDVIGGIVTISQGTSGAMPSLQVADLAGHDVASFDGGDRLAGTVPIYNTNPVSIFAVWKTTDTSNTDIIAMIGNTSTNNGFGISRNISTGYNSFVWNGAEPAIAGTANTWAMHLGQRNASGLRSGLNGVLSAYSTTSLNLTSGAISVGTATNGVDGPVNGKLAALVVGPFSDSDIDKLFGWAAHEYNLAANLPADHPYKSTPPTI